MRRPGERRSSNDGHRQRNGGEEKLMSVIALSCVVFSVSLAAAVRGRLDNKPHAELQLLSVSPPKIESQSITKAWICE